jgi:hypothetical protein
MALLLAHKQQYREIGFDSQTAELTTSETNTLYIEDSLWRIQLSHVRTNCFPTGNVIGVVGALDPSKPMWGSTAVDSAVNSASLDLSAERAEPVQAVYCPPELLRRKIS